MIPGIHSARNPPELMIAKSGEYCAAASNNKFVNKFESSDSSSSFLYNFISLLTIY